MNDLTAKANDNFFKLMIIKYPHLNTLKLKNNILSYSNYNLDLKNFCLINFNKNSLSFSLSDYDFFNLTKIHVDINEEQDYIKNEDYNENIIYMQIEALVVKSTMSDSDRKILDNFINAYKSLLSYQDYLLDNAIVKLNKMSNFIYTLINSPYLEQTEGLKLLHDINNNNEALSTSKGPKLILNNSNFPSMIKDEEDYFLPKTTAGGYASIMLLIYVVLNIGFILAIILIK